MSTYAIGDIQGCYSDFRRLLDLISFDPTSDELWLTGDLVNRGPENLHTVRFVRELGESAVVVLGNHDLHLLAIVFGKEPLRSKDTLADILRAEDCEELAHWMRSRPLLHESNGHVLVHAGIPHIWTKQQATTCASEVEEFIRGSDYPFFFEQMYGDEPAVWSESLTGMDRLRNITNYFTRMRYVKPDGTMEFEHKLSLDFAPEGYKAWFEYPSVVSEPIIFGHWASLNGLTGNSQFLALDTGCVWGRQLTTIRLQDRARYTIQAEVHEPAN